LAKITVPKKEFYKLKEMRDLQLLRTSGLFDKDWYLAKNPDVAFFTKRIYTPG